MTLRPALVVEADGGSRGNPGVAGYGALVRDARTGELLAERAAPLGKASNNVAEYTGLVAGLQAVLDLGLADDATIEVRMDSKLVVEQMSGRWKIKHEDMRRLAMQARRLVDAIQQRGGSVELTWVPRAKNGAADALSNVAMDGETVVRDHVRPASEGSTAETVSEQDDDQASVDPWSLLEIDEDEPDQPADALRPTFGDGRVPLSDVYVSDETVPTLEGQTRLILVRHGVTDFTQRHLLDGRGGADPALNATGMAQARAAAVAVRRLVERSQPGPLVVVSSSLQRARQTGQAIADHLGVAREEDRDWDEQGFGEWDGRAMGDLVRDHGDELLRLRTDPDFAPPGGETRRELDARVGEALARAIGRGGTVVVATHRVVLMSVLGRLLGVDSGRAWSIATAPASLTAIEVWPDGGAQVAFVNDTHHLYDPAFGDVEERPANVTIVDASRD
ncbi:bifunctional RNase H/acid phosphatase [Ornithinimicrobium humiphilum]|uniref:Putative phosphoglycerate mutase n=1 Tax=Ornithinimicrobium humiphilum TaxID=125288 RepID=A0A543KPT4_9MICO|nr:bifunctional RNase H/acid phosphatase [Ornithinimicrobium humiphilum]TQM97095.1 putative phosphoglycerate mutase [Ornithinimicrobium humiphilum]